RRRVACGAASSGLRRDPQRWHLRRTPRLSQQLGSGNASDALPRRIGAALHRDSGLSRDPEAPDADERRYQNAREGCRIKRGPGRGRGLSRGKRQGDCNMPWHFRSSQRRASRVPSVVKDEGGRMKAEEKQFAVAQRFILHPSSFILVLFIALSLSAATIESPAMWLRTHALPLASVEPSADDSDLTPFLPFLANAHIIALGDATHGTHEFFSVKQRLIRLLVKHANVRTIAFEAPYGEFEAIRDYVRTGAGDPAAQLRNDDYFFWNTDEVLDTIRWVRAWNAAGNPPVDIVGVDAYHTKTTIARLLVQPDPS